MKIATREKARVSDVEPDFFGALCIYVKSLLNKHDDRLTRSDFPKPVMYWAFVQHISGLAHSGEYIIMFVNPGTTIRPS